MNFAHPLFFAAAGDHGEDRLTTFFTQMVLLIIVGRILGEGMQRIRQPAVMGQLMAGIILGPSVFGLIWPSEQQAIFPMDSSGRQMLSAVSELGILLLLLLTGMETDLALVKRVRRSAILTSAGGILFPFACGYVLGEFLPASLLPDPHKRLMTSLFLATALSISSVKIVAAVLREVDFLRRDLGQVILASSILDDTIGWTMLALIGGLAAHGTVEVGPVIFSLGGTALFLLVTLTLGGPWVARIIRFTNDNFVGEMPVISVVLVIMLLTALLTSFIGVHTVLGAFVAGIMIGQSPILTKHIDEQLRGLIIALFMPIFFGVAGLFIDLKVLADPHFCELTLLVVIIASIGKLGGCFLGSLFSGLSAIESLAVGLGMNARGSTEIILATIGLSLGVLNQQLYTVIVLMAVVTTLCMPPLLRWALSHVTIREEEKIRLEKEAAEEKELLPKIERMLVGLGQGEGGAFTARLAGWLIGSRKISATVIDWAGQPNGTALADEVPRSSEILTAATTEAMHTVHDKTQTTASDRNGSTHPLEIAAQDAAASGDSMAVSELVSVFKAKESLGVGETQFAATVMTEEKNGYGMIFIGPSSMSHPGEFQDSLEKIVKEFAGPTAILFGNGNVKKIKTIALNKILVPTTGADYSRVGAEVAVGIAKGCGASITALHVSVSIKRDPLREPARLLRSGQALVSEIEILGKREGVHVQPKALMGWSKEGAILRQAELGGYQLIVIGSKSQSNEHLHFGTSAMAIIEKAPCPVLIVKS